MYENEIQGHIHTCCCKSSRGFVSSGQEDNVLLRGVDIVVLKQKQLVDSMVLQGRELDGDPDSICQRLLDHQVLLASDLGE